MYWILNNNQNKFSNVFKLTENETEFENKIGESII